MSAMNAEKLAAVYVKIREARRELAKKDEELKAQLDVVSEQLLEICKEQGAQTIRTPHGTISRRLGKHYWTSDWDSMYRFIREHDAFALLEKRLHQSHMKEFLAENPDLQPAGLNVESEYTVVVRRAKGN